MDVLYVFFPFPTKPLPSGGFLTRRVRKLEAEFLSYQSKLRPRLPQTGQGRAELCFINMSSSACGALNTGHEGPSGTWGVSWSLVLLALAPGGSESAAPHFPYLCPCWALAEVRDYCQGYDSSLALLSPTPIEGGRDPLILPALLSLKILVVGPSPALWLPTTFITRLRLPLAYLHLSRALLFLCLGCPWGYST